MRCAVPICCRGVAAAKMMMRRVACARAPVRPASPCTPLAACCRTPPDKRAAEAEAVQHALCSAGTPLLRELFASS